MTDQIKRGIGYEVNSLFQGKGLVNRESTVEVNSLRALKLGGQEGVFGWKTTFPGSFGGFKKRLPNMLCDLAIS